MSNIDVVSTQQGRCSAPSVVRGVVRWSFLPVILLGVNSAGIWLVSTGRPKWQLGVLFAVAVVWSFAAERIAPYEPRWNRPRGDWGRDVAHAFVNEALQLGSLVVLPVLVDVAGRRGAWPDGWPFWVQVVVAVVVLDAGITVAHWCSHRWVPLWRLHSVHHSVTRFYGFNGLMKHPLHQLFETSVATLPLVLFGLPVDVATAVAFCVGTQLLLQHSNVDYRAGAVRWLIAVNQLHRFHHLKWPGFGDVNFGLFFTVWDRMLGTAVWDRSRRFTSADIGIGAEPNYPVTYVSQLIHPFQHPQHAGRWEGPASYAEASTTRSEL
jgi:sterol desaturase/sphingolipid hydroxylase (fatty acid hydroxylase superfamily)